MRYRLLGDLPPEELRRVISVARRRSFERGEVVFHEGDPGDALHLIEKGRFVIRVTTPIGERATLAILGPGETFGELAIIAPAPRSATVAALEPAETYSLSKSDFEQLRRDHPSVNHVLVAVLAASLRRMDELLLEAFYTSADKRVLRRVRELAEVYADSAAARVIPLTQEDLAGLAGTSRATVNRVLREEEQRGTLRLERGRTIVLDLEQLTRRAQ